ncbi:siderophore biosynthesis protein, IucA/IucC family [Acinetobacter sp. TGL-Y2]|uniref:IucA/IucC family protein n=1 Tax=Acinetobacter sp. TGL-Y2 TaxID=1407071 RepID=UPI0007A68087|nr:IucA/IucC family protein [Acinetobacter sp. TGL-Y2]AMW78118.1 siderophore biosynthesis protein, IucA/IucC family [Acinetobacter sp. TGL-Y2]
MNTMLFSPTVTAQMVWVDLVNSFLVEGYISEQYIFTEQQAKTQLEARFEQNFSSLFEAYSNQAYFVVLFNSTLSEFIILPVRKAIKQDWQIQPFAPAFSVLVQMQQNFQLRTLNALELFDSMQCLGYFTDCKESKLNAFRLDLQLSLQQNQLSTQHQIQTQTWDLDQSAQLFIQLEQYAGLRDRPYHPLAKLKDGFSKDEYQQYSPEFSQPIALNWIAIKKEKLVFGQDVIQLEIHQPAKIFLHHNEYLQLQHELNYKGINEEYLTLPVHVWQFEHVLEQTFAQELADHVIIPLQFQSTEMYASSSLRSLLSSSKPQDSLKLPLAVKSLGSLRFLPIVKMINGQKNQKLLQVAKQKDDVLKKRLWLCDESQWWAYLPHQPENLTPDNLTLFDERPMHLAAQRRRIPAELLQQPYQIIPMASLGHFVDGELYPFELILKAQNIESNKENVIQIFVALCRDFFEVNLRLFRLGLMGEIHGQNICIVLKNGQFSGFMLRDHDSVRIYLPWLQQHGLQDPHYLSPHDFKITLYHDSIEELILYLQTLGIQVNLASILESIAEYYQIEEYELWQVVAQQLQEALNEVPLNDEARAELQHLLFEKEQWPYKQLIRPLLQQKNRVGSMPSSVGKIGNILKNYQAFYND